MLAAAAISGLAGASAPWAITYPSLAFQSQNQTHAALESEALSPQQQRLLQIFSLIVLNPSADITSETRRNAAQELVALDVPEAIDVLDQALRSEKPPLMQAAIGAMQSAAAPIPSLLEPALRALPSASATVIESLSWAVARYGNEALERVAAMATDRDVAVASRLGPIRALSVFDSQAAAAALMSMLNDPDEPAEIVLAVCEAMQGLSGLTYGVDAAQWRQWWKEASSLPAEQWSAYINKSLSKRAAQLQQDLQKQRETNETVSKELFAAYRDLYPALATEEQLRRLPNLLQNQFAAVREFAMSRVTLLLRDSVRIGPEVQQRLAERLNDESPALRVQAARLLDELNYELAGSAIATRLNVEQSSHAITAFLDILARRPSTAALEPARKWLGDPEWSDKAALILWRIHETTGLPAERLPTVRADVRRLFQPRRAPALARLLAWIGDEHDLPQLTSLLDDDDPALRAAISEGYCQRGLRQPLIDRVHDPAVYPFAVRAVTEGPADLVSFGVLVGLPPLDGEANRKTWNDGVAKMAGKLSNGQLLAADDILAAAPHADPALRQSVLSRAAMLSREDLSNEQRNRAIARLAPLLIEQGEAAKAHGLLEGVNCELPELRTFCFEAAALSGHYQKALELERAPDAWIALLVRSAERDVAAARPLCLEIARRFAGQLTPDDQAILDRITDAIRQAESAAAMR